MTDSHLFYAPGDWTLLSRAGRSLLIEATPADSGVARLWSILDIASRPTEVLEQLIEVLPEAGYCLVDVRGEQLVLAQQRVRAELDGQPIDAGGAPVPVEVPDRGGVLIATVTRETPALRIPIEGGVVTAGALVVVRDARPIFTARPYPPAVRATELLADEVLTDEVLEEEAPSSTFRVPHLDSLLLATLTEAGLRPEPVVLDELGAQTPAPTPAQTPAQTPAPMPAQIPLQRQPTEDEVLVAGTVLAGQCPQGHLSGAYSATCRVCDAPMAAQEPRTVPRPPLGVLVLATGETIALDRPAVLGRAPRAPEDALEMPQLVNLAAFGRDISRQHAEVVLRGWNVAVRDLDSANGTRVRDPDGTTTTLEPGTLVPLRPGSMIDVAGVTTLRYEVPR